MSKGKVLIAAPVHQVLTQGLADAGYEYVIEERITQEQALHLIKDYVGIVTSTRLEINRELIDKAAMLQWIGRMGSGMEIIDVRYAESKNIKCFSSPEGNSNAVAEHALGMLLSVTKRITYSHMEVMQNKWRRDENRGTELEGKTIGIIGFGHTGQAFARKLIGFDMNILIYDKYNNKKMPVEYTRCADLTPILKEADIVSFHVPAQEDTVHYLDKKFIDGMTKAFIVINTSRGVIVDTKEMLKGLKAGKIKGACLDVWEQEPLEKMNDEIKELLMQTIVLPQVVITPHIAGYSYEAVYKMSSALLQKIINI